jgi:hypothetical protein
MTEPIIITTSAELPRMYYEGAAQDCQHLERLAAEWAQRDPGHRRVGRTLLLGCHAAVELIQEGE